MKKWKWILLTLLLLLLLIPLPVHYKDGGTVSYRAVLWSYTKYHTLQTDDTYSEGTAFRIFPFNWINQP